MKPWRRTWKSTLEASIYRIHEKPDPKRVMEFEEVAAHFGYSLGVGAIPVKKFAYTDRRRDGSQEAQRDVLTGGESPHFVAELSEAGGQIEGKPEERILSYLMLRSLKQARYSTDKPATSRWRGPTRTSRRPSGAIRT
jgi:ribonuclease R